MLYVHGLLVWREWMYKLETHHSRSHRTL